MIYRQVNEDLVDTTLSIRGRLPQNPVRRALDLACGTGAVTQLLVERLRSLREPVEVIAVDPSESALEKARRLSAALLASCAARLRRSPALLAGSRDPVLQRNHLLPDKHPVLREARAALNRDGVLGFNTSFYEGCYAAGTEKFYRLWMLRSLQLLKQEHGMRPERGKVEAMRWLTPDEYRSLLEEHGFAVEEMRAEVALMPMESWQDISQYSEFANGALPGVPLEVAVPILQRTVEQAYQELGISELPRNWLRSSRVPWLDTGCSGGTVSSCASSEGSVKSAALPQLRLHIRARGLWTAPAIRPLLLGIFVLSLYLLTASSDLKHNGDTDLRYQTAQAMLEHHRIWVANPMWMDARMALGRGHHLYAFYAPGQAVLMMPLYLAGKAMASAFNLPTGRATLYAARSLDLFLGAALAVLIYLFALAAGYSQRVSTLLTLILAVCTVAWPDAQSALEQTQVDLFLLLGVYALWRFVRGDMSDRRWLLVTGIAAGIGLFTRYDAALYIPVLALFPAALRWRRGERAAIPRDWIVYGCAVLPWAFLVALWNIARFRSPFLTGLHEKTLGEPFPLGFLGLTVSPGKGLLWYVPLVFLLPICWPAFHRRAPALSIWCAALIAVPLLFYSNVLYWHGDPGMGTPLSVHGTPIPCPAYR